MSEALVQLPTRSPRRGQRKHLLFRNPLTAKRFPALTTIPEDTLAGFFHLDNTNAQPRKPAPPPASSPSTPSLHIPRPPFVPCNPGQAKRDIRQPERSIFDGVPYESVRIASNKEREKHHGIIRNIARGRDFLPCSSTEAKDLIKVNVFQNSCDAEMLHRNKELTYRRAKDNLIKYNEAGIGRAHPPAVRRALSPASDPLST